MPCCARGRCRGCARALACRRPCPVPPSGAPSARSGAGGAAVGPRARPPRHLRSEGARPRAAAAGTVITLTRHGHRAHVVRHHVVELRVMRERSSAVCPVQPSRAPMGRPRTAPCRQREHPSRARMSRGPVRGLPRWPVSPRGPPPSPRPFRLIPAIRRAACDTPRGNMHAVAGSAAGRSGREEKREYRMTGMRCTCRHGTVSGRLPERRPMEPVIGSLGYHPSRHSPVSGLIKPQLNGHFLGKNPRGNRGKPDRG